MCVGAHRGQRTLELDPHYELPDVGAGTQTQTLFQSSKHS